MGRLRDRKTGKNSEHDLRDISVSPGISLKLIYTPSKDDMYADKKFRCSG